MNKKYVTDCKNHNPIIDYAKALTADMPMIAPISLSVPGGNVMTGDS